MYNYSLGLKIGKSIQHSLDIDAENLLSAKSTWAFQKAVVGTKNWDSIQQTYKGYELICTKTNDPSHHSFDPDIKQKPQIEPKTKIGYMAPKKKVTDTGSFINLPDNKEIPDWELKKTKKIETYKGESGFFDEDMK